jgi:hypothetical protein
MSIQNLAAQLVARDNVSLALLGNTEEFRTYVLSRLQDVIAVSLVTGQDSQNGEKCITR